MSRGDLPKGNLDRIGLLLLFLEPCNSRVSSARGRGQGGVGLNLGNDRLESAFIWSLKTLWVPAARDEYRDPSLPVRDRCGVRSMVEGKWVRESGLESGSSRGCIAQFQIGI